MGWRNKWTEKVPRPEVKRLSSEHKERILKSLEKGITNSPVLSALHIRVRALRGRFYFERLWPAEEEFEIEVIGRITPLTTERNNLLFELVCLIALISGTDAIAGIDELVKSQFSDDVVKNSQARHANSEE